MAAGDVVWCLGFDTGEAWELDEEITAGTVSWAPGMDGIGYAARVTAETDDDRGFRVLGKLGLPDAVIPTAGNTGLSVWMKYTRGGSTEVTAELFRIIDEGGETIVLASFDTATEVLTFYGAGDVELGAVEVSRGKWSRLELSAGNGSSTLRIGWDGSIVHDATQAAPASGFVIEFGKLGGKPGGNEGDAWVWDFDSVAVMECEASTRVPDLRVYPLDVLSAGVDDDWAGDVADVAARPATEDGLSTDVDDAASSIAARFAYPHLPARDVRAVKHLGLYSSEA